MEVRLILGDQLNHEHSWFEDDPENVVYTFFEMKQETGYVLHHIQKVVGFFLAMRAFADHLKKEGCKVEYYSLDDDCNTQDLKENIKQVIEKYDATSWAYQYPDEYRLDQQLKGMEKALDLPCNKVDTEHFLTTRTTLSEFFGDKQMLMENFYRMMRKKYDVLMDGEEPITGKWNYDHENRKKIPKNEEVPEPKVFLKDVGEIVKMLEEEGIDTMGKIDPDAFLWPTTRKEGLEMLEFFIAQCLPRFGKYQDALTPDHWSVFHSRISFVLNTKLLHPLEVIRAVEKSWSQDQDRVTIAQVEGFIRQILGWREYMRGIYWKYMPEYADKNYFNHKRPLPEWYWTGETKMKCLSHAIEQSLDYAYAHHIQRLMVTGNFALLAGIDPAEVDQWYLGVYIDAIEWVEITNTRGMSQFADGGIVGSKPYISSGSYINKMGHYCKDCHYNVKDKTGELACPFNSLYWNFIDQHEDQLKSNPRMSMMYRIWEKMGSDQQEALLTTANDYLENINEL